MEQASSDSGCAVTGSSLARGGVVVCNLLGFMKEGYRRDINSDFLNFFASIVFE